MYGRYGSHVLGVGYPYPGGGAIHGRRRRRVHGQYVIGQGGQIIPVSSPLAPAQGGGFSMLNIPGALMPAQGTPQAMMVPQAAMMHPAMIDDGSGCMTPPGYTPAITVPVPSWRGPGSMLAPGLPAPGEGHVPLPLNPETTGTFTVGGASVLTFSGKPQKPFKTTRLVVVASHVPAVAGGPTTPARVLGQIFVGTDLQQAELGNIDLETLGAANAFDTWLSFVQAEPGVLIRIQAALSTPLLIAGESVVVNMAALGHWVS